MMRRAFVQELIAVGGGGIGGGEVTVGETLNTSILTVRDLVSVLSELDQDLPIAVGVGGYKAALVAVTSQLMTPDLRSGWWDRHVDGSALEVVVLKERGRSE